MADDPARPALVLELDIEQMTLDDLEIFEQFSVKRFKAFMARYSNWTAAQVGALTLAELRGVSAQIARQIAERAVPKATA